MVPQWETGFLDKPSWAESCQAEASRLARRENRVSAATPSLARAPPLSFSRSHRREGEGGEGVGGRGGLDGRGRGSPSPAQTQGSRGRGGQTRPGRLFSDAQLRVWLFSGAGAEGVSQHAAAETRTAARARQIPAARSRGDGAEAGSSPAGGVEAGAGLARG